jgi:hypothetical protein
VKERLAVVTITATFVNPKHFLVVTGV